MESAELLGFQLCEKIDLEISFIFRSSGVQFIWIINYEEADLTFANTLLTYYHYFWTSSNWFGISSLRNLNFHQKFSVFVFTFSFHFSRLTERQNQTGNFKKLLPFSYHIFCKYVFEITVLLLFIKYPKCNEKIKTFGKEILWVIFYEWWQIYQLLKLCILSISSLKCCTWETKNVVIQPYCDYTCFSWYLNLIHKLKDKLQVMQN